MRAVRIDQFGGPEVLKWVEVERPIPAADEILVRVFATSINPADAIVRKGGNDLLRPLLKLPLILGLDVAGVVEEVGREVTQFRKGDEVYGVPNLLAGSYAEYVSARACQFAKKPRTASFCEAAAVPSCALMAWSGIVDVAQTRPGQRVLVHGAAGGVGVLALQMAKARGAAVIATASASNHAFLRELGADETIDYREPWDQVYADRVDVAFNASPVREANTRQRLATILVQGGVLACSQVDLPWTPDILERLERKGAHGASLTYTDHRTCLDTTAGWIDQGRIRVIVSRVYARDQVAEAHRAIETHHVRGKLVLDIAADRERG